VLAFSVVKLKLEYPLALHQNSAKKPCQPLIPILSAASLTGVRGLGGGVTRWKQQASAMSGTSTAPCVATDLLRRGAEACVPFASRSSLRGCARCSMAEPKTPEQPTHDRRLGPILSRVLALAVFTAGSRFSPNCDKLNRQTREFRNAVTYRKQTIANHSNRQNSQFCPTVFLAPFQSDAGSALPLRIPRA
jgi:hypothetical protein